MKDLMDFQIIQREADGYATVPFGGTLETDIPEETPIIARAVREDDNMVIVYWTQCRREGREWSIDFRLPEGGLYRLEACVQNGDPAWCGRIKCVYHIGVGDIFVTTGQSNMTGYGRDNAYDPPVLGVHAFQNTGHWGIATHPLSDAIEGIFAYPENASGTSPVLSFARRLKERLGVPIGIVPTAVGGTPLSSWNPEQDGGCYRAMCERLDRIGAFKGFLWYQGCSDAIQKEAGDYLERFARMIALWREKYGDHPVLTVQLNRWTGGNNPDNDPWWGMIRDAQRRAGLELHDVYVVPSLDLPCTDGIHNSSGANVLIGERLANVALAGLYGKPGQTVAAVVGAEQIDDTHVLVHITPGHHVTAMDGLATGMNVEDGEGLVECAEAQPVQDGLVVRTSRSYHLPAKFHHAWRAVPPVFVPVDYCGMPMLACYGVEIEKKRFRTDRS